MAQAQITGFEALAKQSALYPQESMVAVRKDHNALFIGLPREVSLQENRIALTPDAVRILVRNGHEVWLETNAGRGANFTDHEYSEAGARIVQSPKEVYQANLILKVEPLVEEEFGYIKAGTTLISALNLPTLEKSYFEKLNQSVNSQIRSLYQTFQTNLQLVKLEQQNLEVARQNMDITLEKFRLGSVAPLEFREAQRNYINANTRYTNAQFEAKLAEVALLQLSGQLKLQ